MDCEWCDDDREGIPVEEFADGLYHAPCHELLVKYTALVEALKATGWTQEEFRLNTGLLAQELPEERD